jgi:hypothetical protein
MKGNVRLFLQIPPSRAALIVGSLYGAGVLSRGQYERNMRRIDAARLEAERRKNEKLEKRFAEIREFYKKEVRN